MKQVLLASHNARKLKELRRILEDELPDIEVLGLADVDAYDEPVETEYTFEGNALIKARAAVKVTGLPALADDSGICLDALNGMPGVLSARWAGLPKADRGVRDTANNRLLLAQTADDRLTLVTCYPLDALVPGGPLRYVVRAVEARRYSNATATVAPQDTW